MGGFNPAATWTINKPSEPSPALSSLTLEQGQAPLTSVSGESILNNGSNLTCGALTVELPARPAVIPYDNFTLAVM